MNLFKGATRMIGTFKKEVKLIKRGDIVCTCGALDKYYTTLYYIHDKTCIINKEKVDAFSISETPHRR